MTYMVKVPVGHVCDPEEPLLVPISTEQGSVVENAPALVLYRVPAEIMFGVDGRDAVDSVLRSSGWIASAQPRPIHCS